jgi:5-methylcytosine-specific restriction protein B
MRDTEFRGWLAKRRFRGALLKPGMIEGRTRRLARIPRALKALGFDEEELHEVHNNGRWSELMTALKAVVDDWRSNPAAARAITPRAPDPTRQLSNVYYAARQYGFFADGKDPNYGQDESLDNLELDEEALAALKAMFLAKFPDFESGAGFPGKSSYHPEEDAYKRPLIAKVQELLARPMEATALGARLLSLVLDDKDMNLVGDYRRKNHLRTVRDRSGGKLEAAVGALASSKADPPEAAAAFVADAWAMVLEGSEHSKPYGDIRILATLFPALARPRDAICVATRKFDHLGRALLGRRPFGDNVLTAAEYRGILDLAGELFTIMEDWGWGPRDLWDVQGFIWVTCEDRLDARTAGDADRVRQYALETYIEPARRRGDPSVTVRAGDVHKAVGLANAHANVCQALRGDKFLGMAGVERPSYTGPDNSSTTTFTYNLQTGGPAMAATSDETVNLILYGPPGTGKTYRTAAEAVKLCDGLSGDDPLLTDDDRRGELMERYRALLADDRIGFVTFHQNFSYEDFVEGLRPTTLNEDGVEMAAGFRLQPEPGALRKYAELAEALSIEEASASFPLGHRKFFKMSLGEAANPEDDYLFDEAIEQGFLHMGDDSGIDWSEPRFDTKMAMIDAYAEEHPERPVPSSLAGAIEFPFTLRHRVRIGDIIIVSKGNLAFRAIGEVTGDYQNVERDDDYTIRRAVNWHWVNRDGLSYAIINNKRFSQRTVYELAQSELKIEAIQSLLDSGSEHGSGHQARRRRNFVLIIDEINRANISKVFGELITLIEADKRIGRVNELRVLLPYSKKPFGVPPNLHIIGTMNTADRSIALLDTALRRRFVFREVGPEPERLPELVDGVPLRRVLETINDRIEYLVDREHRIGHAFFMGAAGKSREGIDGVMRDKVIPLLQEYFFEDWSRVAAVLGEPEEKGGGFLDCRMLSDPTAQGGDRQPSWAVRRTFAAGAYSRLVAASTPTPELE